MKLTVEQINSFKELGYRIQGLIKSLEVND